VDTRIHGRSVILSEAKNLGNPGLIDYGDSSLRSE